MESVGDHSRAIRVIPRSTRHWSPITYTVSFAPGASDAMGTMPASVFTYDVPRALPKNAYALNGYVFDGWRDASGNKYADMATIVNLSTQAGSDFVLYATWAPRVYAVSFVSSEPNRGTVTYTPRQVATGRHRRYEARAHQAQHGRWLAAARVDLHHDLR